MKILTKHLISLVLLALTPGFAQLAAQSPASSVVKLDPSLDAIISPNAKLEMLKEKAFGLAEGPLWINEGNSGYLLFSDIRGNRIHKWTPDGKVSVFLERTGWTGADPPPIPNGGSNGITLDRQGRIVWVSQGDRAVVRVEKDGKRTVLVDKFLGKRFNRPNDLAVKSDGSIYFTDPAGDAKLQELDFEGVFRFKDGVIQVLDRGDYKPNGVAFSPDEKLLYTTVAGGKTIYRYDVKPDGMLTNRIVFSDMSADKAEGGTDGIKVDQRGNVYSTGPGGLWILSPAAKHLGTILTPEGLTNVAFGDPDGKTLYLTGRTSLLRIRANIAGVRPGAPAPVGGATK